MPPKLDKKFLNLDFKNLTDEGEFEGYAAKFGEQDSYGDTIVGGAFKKTLREKRPNQIKMLWQHWTDEPIGVWTEFKEDNQGLYARGRLLTVVQKGKEAYELIKAGAVEGLSIGYRSVKSIYDDKTGFRDLLEVELFEVSIVSFPAIATAGVTGIKHDWTIRDVERILREAGMPNAMATKLVASGWKAANSRGQGDPDDGLMSVVDKFRDMNEDLKRRVA